MSLLILALGAGFEKQKSFINTAGLHIELTRVFGNYKKTITILINKSVIINTGTTDGIKGFTKGSYYCEGLQKYKSQLNFIK